MQVKGWDCVTAPGVARRPLCGLSDCKTCGKGQPKEQPDEIISEEEISDHDPEGDAYAKGYADGYKAKAIATERESGEPINMGETITLMCKGARLSSDKVSNRSNMEGAFYALSEKFEIRRRG